MLAITSFQPPPALTAPHPNIPSRLDAVIAQHRIVMPVLNMELTAIIAPVAILDIISIVPLSVLPVSKYV